MAAGNGASGDGGGGVFPDMVAIFMFLSLAKSFFLGRARKIRKRANS